MSVAIDGFQRSDGSWTRHITLYGRDGAEQLNAADEARQLARALVTAADQLDELDEALR